MGQDISVPLQADCCCQKLNPWHGIRRKVLFCYATNASGLCHNRAFCRNKATPILFQKKTAHPVATEHNLQRRYMCSASTSKIAFVPIPHELFSIGEASGAVGLRPIANMILLMLAWTIGIWFTTLRHQSIGRSGICAAGCPNT